MGEAGGSENKADTPDSVMDRRQLLEDACKGQGFTGQEQGQEDVKAEVSQRI